MDIVKVFAPATVANLGPGFDILGMAVTEPCDTVIALRIDRPGIVIDSIAGDEGRLPRDPEKNTAGIAADYVRRQIDSDAGVALEIVKGLPLASGLGSSAASAVAAAVAVNTLFGNPLADIELLPALLEAEAAVSGRHADNVAPALLGGIVLVTGTTAVDIHRLPLGPHLSNLWLAMVTPAVAVPTAEARAVLPGTVPLKTVVHQTGAVARLLHAIHTDDVELFAHAMAKDEIVEPARRHLIPYFAEAREVARDHGALASIISGAGPTLCIPARTQSDAQAIGEVVVGFYHGNGVAATSRTVQISPVGARVV